MKTRNSGKNDGNFAEMFHCMRHDFKLDKLDIQNDLVLLESLGLPEENIYFTSNKFGNTTQREAHNSFSKGSDQESVIVQIK